MTWREMVNLAAYLLLLIALMSGFFVLRDVAQHQTLQWGQAAFSVMSLVPWVIMMLSGQSYGMAFAASFYFGGDNAAVRGHSQQRAWARQGRGQEAAHALLWRDRILGDRHGLIAVLELALLEPSLKPEAVRAAHRLFAGNLSKSDREHVGRLYQQIGVGEVKPRYPGHR